MDIHLVLERKFSDRSYICKGAFPNHQIEILDGGEEITDMELIEASDVLEAEMVAEEYKERREKEFPSHKELIIALWEDIVEGRPEAKEALQAKRINIKNKYPKGE